MNPLPFPHGRFLGCSGGGRLQRAPRRRRALAPSPQLGRGPRPSAGRSGALQPSARSGAGEHESQAVPVSPGTQGRRLRGAVPVRAARCLLRARERQGPRGRAASSRGCSALLPAGAALRVPARKPLVQAAVLRRGEVATWGGLRVWGRAVAEGAAAGGPSCGDRQRCCLQEPGHLVETLSQWGTGRVLRGTGAGGCARGALRAVAAGTGGFLGPVLCSWGLGVCVFGQSPLRAPVLPGASSGDVTTLCLSLLCTPSSMQVTYRRWVLLLPCPQIWDVAGAELQQTQALLAARSGEGRGAVSAPLSGAAVPLPPSAAVSAQAAPGTLEPSFS